jgi:large subunit ribosomal protein L24
MQKIRKGDKVVMLAGKDKGRTGEVLQVMPKEDRAFVRGINMVKRHQRQSQTQEAGIINKEASIHLSNIAIVAKDGKPTRVGFSVVDGKKVRVAKRTGDVIDG